MRTYKCVCGDLLKFVSGWDAAYLALCIVLSVRLPLPDRLCGVVVSASFP